MKEELAVQLEELVRQYVSFLTYERKMSDNTVASYQMDVNRFIVHHKINSVEALKGLPDVVVREYFSAMQVDGISSSTIIRHVSSIRSFYKFLQFNKILTEDPTIGVVKVRVTRKTPEILTEKEIETLLKKPEPKTVKGVRDTAMLMMVCYAGLRVLELTAMLLEDVDLKNGQVVCRANKNRVVKLPAPVLSALRDYIEKSRPMMSTHKTTNALFLNCSNGRTITRQGFWKFVKTYQKQANIGKMITPKILRHSFAARLVRQNTSLKTMQELLGHNDPSSTQLYVQLMKQALVEEES